MPYYTIQSDKVLVSPITGAVSFTSLQTVFDVSRSAGKPLFFLPGNYSSGGSIIINANTTTAPVLAQAAPGTVVFILTGAGILLDIEGVFGARFEGITFNGNNAALNTTYSFQTMIFAGAGASNVVFDHCQITNSPGIGIYTYNSASPAIINQCKFSSLSQAIFSDASQVIATNNNISGMTNSGIYIWNTPSGSPTNIVRGNTITFIASGSGAGQNGNGVDLYVASLVQVVDNVISHCRYSAIRFNTGADVVIANNVCTYAQDSCIFIEAPGANTLTTAVSVTGNVIDNCTNGITVTNEGQFGDGVTRSVSISGNHLSNLGFIQIGGANPTPGLAFGIHVEAGTTVSGNVVDTVSGNGIDVGVNSTGADLVVSGNYVRGVVLGIGVANGITSGVAGTNAIVSSNIVRTATGGAIVPTTWLGTGYPVTRVSGSPDFGNSTLTTAGNATFVANRAAS